MITVEDIAPEQFELVAGWLSRPDTNRWLSSEWRDRATTPSMIAILLRNRKNRLFIVKKETIPCGLVGLADIDAADRTAMVWYVLGDLAMSGQGITSEAVRVVSDLAFREMQLCSLYAWVMEDNLASVKVLNRAGFQRAGCLRSSVNSSGRQVDRLFFDLTKDDFLRGTVR